MTKRDTMRADAAQPAPPLGELRETVTELFVGFTHIFNLDIIDLRSVTLV